MPEDSIKSVITAKERSSGIERLVRRTLRENQDARVLKIKIDGKSAWVKRAIAADWNRWHTLQSIIFKITRNPLFAPTVAVNAKEAIQGEAKRLQKLKSVGLPVPTVLATDSDWVVLEDFGIPACNVLRDPARTRTEQIQIISTISEQLATMHHLNRWHGRPVLKDILWNGNQVAFLDFEEDLAPFLNPASCAVRDAIIYIHSLFRVLKKDRVLAEHGFTAYWNNAPVAVRATILREIDAMEVLVSVEQLFRPILGGDALAIFATIRRILEESKMQEVV